MLNKLFDYFFWFIQPSSVLSRGDIMFGYTALALLVVAVVCRVLTNLSKNPVDAKLFLKIWHMAITTGIFGLIWFGLRFENTPIFAERYWFGLVLIVGIIWGLFILKYLAFNYFKEKQEYSREALKNKYIPKAK